MAADASKPTASADSYLGSFISLTSKSDIRYEGVLVHLNAQESTIGLRNVRSFGTEGRKKDGPQVLPSDRVYEYIFFRGNDIKDLQVISSPPVQSAPAIPDDPAIIQLHYPHPASASLPSAGTGSVTNLGSNPQLGLPSSTFQDSLPLDQPVGNLGSWNSSPSPPNASVSELTVPTYRQGFIGPSGGPSNLQDQSLLQSEPGMVESSPLKQQTQYPSMTASLSSSAPKFPEFPHSLLPPVSTGTPKSSSTFLAPSTLPSNFRIGHSTALASNLSPKPMPRNSSTALPAVTLGSTLPLVSPLAVSSLDINSITPPNADKPKLAVGLTLPYQTMSRPMPSVVGTSGSNHTEVSLPFLVTPGQLLQSNPTTLSSSHFMQTSNKDIEVVQASTSGSVSSDSEEAPASILPSQSPYDEMLNEDALHTHHSNMGHSQGRGYRLNGAALHAHHTNRGHSWGRGNVVLGAALRTHHSNKSRGWGRGIVLNGAALHTHHSNRGRTWGRGNRISHSVTKFTEDFDFEAMNEKFNKDEVWGHLGKSKEALLKPVEGDDEDDIEAVDKDALPKFEMKPAYVKDDFFDSLSCNPLDLELQRGRATFSEQMKIDTETFGNFQRHRGRHGIRGLGRGSWSRGSYYGRGYGYAGRGPPRTMLSRVT